MTPHDIAKLLTEAETTPAREETAGTVRLKVFRLHVNGQWAVAMLEGDQFESMSRGEVRCWVAERLLKYVWETSRHDSLRRDQGRLVSFVTGNARK